MASAPASQAGDSRVRVPYPAPILTLGQYPWFTLEMSTPAYRQQYADLLGMPLGKANFRLWKQAVWHLLQDLGRDVCFRCNKPMTEDTYSLDHYTVWRGASAALFWDPANIGWSHHRCNVAEARYVSRPNPKRRHVIEGKLHCSRCNRDKLVSEFGKSTRAWNGYASACLDCSRSRTASVKAARGSGLDVSKHGKVSTYETYGCRCDPCRKAASDYRKIVNAARKARKDPPILA